MIRKKLVCIGTALVFSVAAFAACAQPEQSGETDFTKTAYTFTNLSREFPTKEAQLTTYFKEGSIVPYVGVEDFLTAMDGIFNVSGFDSSVSEEDSEYILHDTRGGLRTFTADWEEDTVIVSGFDFFSALMEDTSSTDYGAHMELLTQWQSPSHAVTFDLGEYGFDIVYEDGKLLLPFYIANLLFCSSNLYNVYFNGEEYFGLLQSDLSLMTPEDWAEVRTCAWNDTEAPAEMREVTVSFLEFALDNYYGLKDYKGIKSFGDDVLTGDLREELLSGDPEVHNAAYIDLFQKTLNELHTTLMTPSFYASADAVFDLNGENGGTALENYIALNNELSMDMVNSIGVVVQNPDGTAALSIPAVRFEGDTAIIILTGFTIGTDDQIYNDDGTVSEDARQYDSFYFMKNAMDTIEKHEETTGTPVENVVLDLTVNGGGSLAAMISVLGFMTDEPIMYTYGNGISEEEYIEYYLVDTDEDGDVRDEDAYDMYDWYVLTSPLTFSAANLLSSIVKTMGIATLIGEQSGGGTCAVFTLVLPDGTTTNMSGSWDLLLSPKVEQGVVTGGEFVESGIVPDIALDKEFFYNDEALVAAIHDAK